MPTEVLTERPTHLLEERFRDVATIPLKTLGHGLLAASLVLFVGHFVCASGSIKFDDAGQGALSGLINAGLTVCVLLIGARIAGLRLAKGAAGFLSVFVVAEMIDVSAHFVPKPSWAPDHVWNWEGKIVATIALVAFVVVGLRSRFADIGISRSLAVPRQGWRLVGPLCVLGYLFVIGTYLLLANEKVTADNWFFEATMPGLQEEFFRGLSLVLFAAALTGTTSLRALTSDRVVYVAVGANTAGFALGHLVYVNSDWSVSLNSPSNLITALFGFAAAMMMIRTRSIWPGVFWHNITNLELFGPTVAITFFAVVLWALWYRVRQGKFDWTRTGDTEPAATVDAARN